MQKCTECGHTADKFPEVPLKEYDAVVVVTVTFEVRTHVKTTDRASAVKALQSKADEEIREQLDGANIRWEDSDVEKLDPHEVCPREWTEAELETLRHAKPDLTVADVAKMFPDCVEADVRDQKLAWRKKEG